MSIITLRSTLMMSKSYTSCGAAKIDILWNLFIEIYIRSCKSLMGKIKQTGAHSAAKTTSYPYLPMDKCAKRWRQRLVVTSFHHHMFFINCILATNSGISSKLADLIVKAGSVHGYPWLVGLQDVFHSHSGHVDHNKADMPEKTRVLKQCRGSGTGTGSGSAGFWASRIRLRIH
jgi:hypothetical protein